MSLSSRGAIMSRTATRVLRSVSFGLLFISVIEIQIRFFLRFTLLKGILFKYQRETMEEKKVVRLTQTVQSAG